MDFFAEDLQFTKIIYKDKFYYPDQVNHEIRKLGEHLEHSIPSDTPFIYLFAHNHIKTIIAYFAIIKSGHICVLVEPDIGKLELEEMKKDTPPCAMVRINRKEEFFDYAADIRFTEDNPREFDYKQLEDVCTIVYTNAEDGHAKGAMLTKRNLLSNAHAGKISDEIDTHNVFYALLPCHHLFGLQTGVLTPIYSSASTIIEDITNLHRIGSVAKVMHTYKVSNLYSIPGIYYLLAKLPGIGDSLQNVDKLCSGGCALPKSIYESFLQKTGREIAEGYGLTEASPVCTWHWRGDKIKIGSIGRSYPCCEVKVLDDAGIAATVGQIGEICVKGDNVMKGYYNKSNATDGVLKHGWLHTGDIGKLDMAGYVFLTGLKKKMLNVGGRKVYPEEVRYLLTKNHNIKNVEVFGEMDLLHPPVLRTNIELIAKGCEHEKAFNAWCRVHISPYKIPKVVNFI